MRLQAKNRPPVDFTGTVDSGATRTVLSIEAAEELGLSTSDLRQAIPVTIADGNEVPSWTAAVPIRGQVQSRSSPTSPLEPWGPTFELQPMFLQTASPLWGQADFFAAFRVTLARDVNPSWFELSY